MSCRLPAESDIEGDLILLRPIAAQLAEITRQPPPFDARLAPLCLAAARLVARNQSVAPAASQKAALRRLVQQDAKLGPLLDWFTNEANVALSRELDAAQAAAIGDPRALVWRDIRGPQGDVAWAKEEPLLDPPWETASFFSIIFAAGADSIGGGMDVASWAWFVSERMPTVRALALDGSTHPELRIEAITLLWSVCSGNASAQKLRLDAV